MKGTKTGGRQAGTPNKLTTQVRQTLKDIFSNELEDLPAHLKTLTPQARIDFLIKIAPYVLPKVEAVTPTSGEPLQWDFSVND
jgi:hypothetical protein